MVKRASAFAYGTAPNCGHSSRPRSGDGGTWARARAVSPAPSPAVPRQAGSPELVASSRFLWARYGAPPGYKRAYARTPAALVLPTQGTPQGLSPGCALDTLAMDIAVTLFPGPNKVSPSPSLSRKGRDVGRPRHAAHTHAHDFFAAASVGAAGKRALS